MKFFLLILLFTLPVLSKTEFSIRELPEVIFIRKKVDLYTRTPQEIEKAQLQTHEVVAEIVSDVKKLKVKFPNERFFIIDMKENKVLYVCQEILSTKNVPPELIVRRPKAKYLSIKFEGLPEEASFGQDIEPYLKKNNLRILSWEAYQYKPSAVPLKRPKEFFLPVGP